jgi:hypothetical protein
MIDGKRKRWTKALFLAAQGDLAGALFNFRYSAA